MIRPATPEDAERLFRLNEQFNGKDETTFENIKYSLLHNPQEAIAVLVLSMTANCIYPNHLRADYGNS